MFLLDKTIDLAHRARKKWYRNMETDCSCCWFSVCHCHWLTKENRKKYSHWYDYIRRLLASNYYFFFQSFKQTSVFLLDIFYWLSRFWILANWAFQNCALYSSYSLKRAGVVEATFLQLLVTQRGCFRASILYSQLFLNLFGLCVGL